MDIGAYNFSGWPRWMYHATELPVWVVNPAQAAELGEGWSETYIAHEWPQLYYGPEGEMKNVASPEEAAELGSEWSTTPPEPLPEGELPLSRGDWTLEQLAQKAKSERRRALDYEQLNDELELKADNTPQKPLVTMAQPQPQYQDTEHLKRQRREREEK